MEKYRITWLLTLIVATGLACNFLAGVGEDVRGMRSTAEAAVEQVQGLATSVEGSGFLKTAQAIATQEGRQLLATAEALATQAQESGFLETAQARATEGISFGEAPDDIPVIDRENVVNFFGSDNLITYSSVLDFETVLEYYQGEMPANGWTALPDQSQVETDSAALEYEKDGRAASVALNRNPLDNTTIVLIMIQGQ